MRKCFKYYATAMLLVLFFSASVLAGGHRIVLTFYYAWYASPDRDGQWLHWNEYNHKPPADIASSFFPRLGPYSSSDPAVVTRHMQWIAGAGIHGIIYSWWGKGDFTDEMLPQIFAAAAERDLKVTLLIEPYEGRTTNSICADIEYLLERFGKDPALMKISRKTAHSDETRARPIFWIYHPEYAIDDLMKLSDTIHNGMNDSILLLHSTDAELIDLTHADGIFAYEAVQNVHHAYRGIAASVRSRNGIFAPSVSPGFNMNRTAAGILNPLYFRGRAKGENYDRWWEKAIAADPEIVAIISFNEWHEGTQIEPASAFGKYQTYDGAFGKKGVPAEQSYLRRTARWINIFLQLP